MSVFGRSGKAGDVNTRWCRFARQSFLGKHVQDETGCRLDIVNDNEVEPADEAEEYESILHPTNCDPRRI
jgi:hypothetical protein